MAQQQQQQETPQEKLERLVLEREQAQANLLEAKHTLARLQGQLN